MTGPTGSGKSTTLAAMIDYINKTKAYNIITIEDPVEFVHESKKSLIKHREVGRHTLKFMNALKGALRQDPDMILVGEIRDRETVEIALKASQTGHLVAGTLHTNSAIKTLNRILDMFGPEEQEAIRVSISESLVAIIAQLLCKTTDGKRAAFHDVMINTDVVKEYILKGQNEEINQIMIKDTYEGMTTMNQSLYGLYQEGRITEELCARELTLPERNGSDAPRSSLNQHPKEIERCVSLFCTGAKHFGLKFVSDRQRFIAEMLRPYEYICKNGMFPIES